MEGSYINKSLLTLGTVIHKMSESRAAHVPFRESKLTRLLQPSLTGSGAKVAIVCTVTPASMQSEETRNTLKFAFRAKKVPRCAVPAHYLLATLELGFVGDGWSVVGYLVEQTWNCAESSDSDALRSGQSMAPWTLSRFTAQVPASMLLSRRTNCECKGTAIVTLSMCVVNRSRSRHPGTRSWMTSP